MPADLRLPPERRARPAAWPLVPPIPPDPHQPCTLVLLVRNQSGVWDQRRMFLVHCLALGAAVHLLAEALLSIDAGRVRDWFGSRTARTPAIAFLTLVPVVFAAVWLVDVIPSEIHDTLPEYAVTNGFISSPVHLLDLGIFFPGLLIAGLLLRRRHPLGFLLAPTLLVFAVVMTSCLVEQSLVLTRRGFDEDLALTAAFGAVTAVGATILVHLLRHPRSRVRPGPDQVIATRAG